MNEQNPLVKWIVRRIKEKNKNCIMIINGPTGSGKTFAGLDMALVLAKELGNRMKTFRKRQEELIEDLSERRKGYDETIKKLNGTTRDIKERREHYIQYSAQQISTYFEQTEIQNYRYLLETLSILIDRLKYFEEEGVTR